MSPVRLSNVGGFPESRSCRRRKRWCAVGLAGVQLTRAADRFRPVGGARFVRKSEGQVVSTVPTGRNAATRRRAGRWIGAAIIALTVGVFVFGGGKDPFPLDEPELYGVTMPSERATLAALVRGRIEEILVPEGSLVREGDVLLALDDRLQRARTEIARAAAESDLNVRLARVRWERAVHEWERLRDLHARSYATAKELEDARTRREERKLEYQLAKLTHEQDRRTLEREEALLREYRLRAPFSGYVAAYQHHKGETVDPLEDVVSVVRLDPLEVIVHVPLAALGTVQAGDAVEVFPVDPPAAPRTATVSLIGKVAEIGSQTVRVKLTVPNPDLTWRAGLKVRVVWPGGNERSADARPHRQRGDPATEPRP
ncbi:MAG: efflux RND transporter periplasmic adaptor subunit [Planctomycetota bacterium]|nr:MAG: efflux RND transporter periplasmic adaptor subunit [Planctomycetota bacterium]